MQVQLLIPNSPTRKVTSPVSGSDGCLSIWKDVQGGGNTKSLPTYDSFYQNFPLFYFGVMLRDSWVLWGFWGFGFVLFLPSCVLLDVMLAGGRLSLSPGQ